MLQAKVLHAGKALGLCLCLAVVMIAAGGCEYDDTVTVQEVSLADASEYEAYSKRARYFVLVPGDFARNGGEVACTVLTDDRTFPANHDLLFFRPDTTFDTILALTPDTLLDTLDSSCDTLGDSLIVCTVVLGDSTINATVTIVDTCGVGEGSSYAGCRMTVFHDSVYYSTLTCEPVEMTIAGASRRLYPQRVYRGPSRDTLGRHILTRYFEQGDTNVYLHAFEDSSGHFHEMTEERIVVPNFVTLGDSWRSAPMMWDADRYVNLSTTLHGEALADTLLASTADSGQVELTPYLIGTKQYYYGLIVKRYFGVVGTAAAADGSFAPRGTIIMDDYYFKDAGLCRQRTRRLLRLARADGAERTIRETVFIDRGNLQARVYSD